MTAWTVAELGPPLVMQAHARPSLSPDQLTLPIAAIDVFGWQAEVSGGTLRLLVDGVEKQSVGVGSHTKDVALATSSASLIWEFVPAAAGDVVTLVINGARPLLAPVLNYLPFYLWSWCGGEPELYFSFNFAATLLGGDVQLTVSEENVTVGAHSYISGDQRRHYVSVDVPRLPDGTPQEISALVEDALGQVWTLFPNRTVEHRLVGDFAAGPHGWVYELRPTLALSSGCVAHDASNVKLFLNGEEVTSGIEKCLNGAQYHMPRDLAFNETIDYVWEITLRDGSTKLVQGTLRGGLDIVEFDVPSLALLWGEASVEMQDDENMGEIVFANLADPGGLPPVYATSREPLGDGTMPPVLLEGARLKAIYAPLGLLCERRPVSCSPYNGEAPGFVDDVLRNAELHIIAPDGHVTVMPGAGQFAAASHLTVLTQGLLENADYYHAWSTKYAGGLVELTEDLAARWTAYAHRQLEDV